MMVRYSVGTIYMLDVFCVRDPGEGEIEREQEGGMHMHRHPDKVQRCGVAYIRLALLFTDGLLHFSFLRVCSITCT